MLKSIWVFLGLYQTKRVRILHALILIFVLTQITISNWMVGTKLEKIPEIDSVYFFTWMHITLGLTLFFLTLQLIITCFTQKGVKYFYPYLWGDFKQIKSDVKQLFSLKLPDSSPYGIAASVQGLGLGALSIVILSGIAWFILWVQHSPLALEARSLHKSLTILIEIYIYGHGGFAILHFVVWRKSKKI